MNIEIVLEKGQFLRRKLVMEINAKNAGLACGLLVGTPPPLQSEMVEFIPVLLSDRPYTEKIGLVLWGLQPGDGRKVMRFTLCDENEKDASFIPAWDRLLAATIVAAPHNADELLDRLVWVIEGLDNGFFQCRHGYILGTLRAIVVLDSLGQCTSAEEEIEKAFSIFLSCPMMPELPPELSSEQSTLLAAFIDAKKPTRLHTLKSMAGMFSNMKSLGVTHGPGVLQFIDNFNYKYFGRLKGPFERARLLAHYVV